jgi:hypothetical protein
MPAQSPTLSPTLSAITAGLRGSSSGIPASILPTRSAPTSAAFVKMPPPRRAKTEISEPPNASPTRSVIARFADRRREEPVVARHAEQGEARHEETRDRAGAEGDVERGLQPAARSLRGAAVRPHGDVHADEACGRRQRGTDQEPERGPPAELVVDADQDERHDRDHRDRRVLLAQVRGRTFLNGVGDLAHPLVPGRLLEQPPGQIEPVRHGNAGTDEAEEDGMIPEPAHPFCSLTK